MSTICGNKENIKDVYDQIADVLGSEYTSVSNTSDKISRFLKQLPEKQNILDIGPGTGHDSLVAIKLGHSVTGVDISPKMQEVYRSKVPLASTILANMTDIPVPENNFDVVLSSCSLLHLDRKSGLLALNEFKRVLKKNGQLLLTTSINNGEEELHNRPEITNLGIKSWYFYHWEKSDLRDVLQNIGFTILGWEEEIIVKERPPVAFIHCKT